jgi:hypothetical protein
VYAAPDAATVNFTSQLPESLFYYPGAFDIHHFELDLVTDASTYFALTLPYR